MYVHDGEGLMYFSIGVCLSNLMKTYNTKALKILSYFGLFILFMYSILCIKYDVESVSGDAGLICGIMISPIIIIWLLNTNFMPWFFKKFSLLGSISMEMCLLHLPVNYVFYNMKTPLKNNIVVWMLLYIAALLAISFVCHFAIKKLQNSDILTWLSKNFVK